MPNGDEVLSGLEALLQPEGVVAITVGSSVAFTLLQVGFDNQKVIFSLQLREGWL